MNYFIYKGRDSRTFQSLVVQELPPITKPPVKYNVTTIDGKDGDIVETLGYKSYDKEISIGIKNTTELDQIIEWLTGNGELVLSNEPDKYYKAQILDQINFERLVKFRTAKIKFHVQPYKYSDLEGIETKNTSSTHTTTITNNGNTISKPIITLTGSGTVNISYNNKEIRFTFDSNGKATFDSEKQDVSNSDILLNRNMIGDFIELNVGQNVFQWTGTITKWEIQNKSRWI